MNPEEYLTAGRVARLLGVTPQTVGDWARCGVLRGYRPGGRVWLFLWSEVQLVLELPSYDVVYSQRLCYSERGGLMDPLIQALIQQQETEGLGNNAFARKLGVDHSTWSTVRRGLEPGRRSGAIFAAAMRLYPHIVRRVAQELEIANEVEGDNHHSETPTSAVAS